MQRQRLHDKDEIFFDREDVLSKVSESDNDEENELDSWHLVSQRADHRPDKNSRAYQEEEKLVDPRP